MRSRPLATCEVGGRTFAYERRGSGSPLFCGDLAADAAGVIADLGLERRDVLPAAWLARVPHWGHGFMADHPEALGRLISTFIAVD